MRSLRALVVIGTVVGLVGAMSPAFAEDLEDYLEMAAEADYAGTRVVLTVWEGRSHAEMTSVEHSGDILMLGSAAGEALIVDGKVTRSEGAGVALATWATPAVSEKYTVGTVADMTRLGRAARAVTILEGDVVRARIIFDLDTWAPLTTEIYDGAGDLFRIASFTVFDSHPRRVYDAMPDEGHDYDLVVAADESSLPAAAGDYARVDMYAGSDGVDQAFFSDGLFSFSVFEVAPRQVRDRFAGADSMRVAGSEYLVLVQPSELWLAWEHGATAYVLVGDLPPDHLERVLVDLPSPKSRSLFERILSFFG